MRVKLWRADHDREAALGRVRKDEIVANETDLTGKIALATGGSRGIGRCGHRSQLSSSKERSRAGSFASGGSWPLYRERAALAWTEAVTKVSENHVAEVVYDEMPSRFTEGELANLTLAIVNDKRLESPGHQLPCCPWRVSAVCPEGCGGCDGLSRATAVTR